MRLSYGSTQARLMQVALIKRWETALRNEMLNEKGSSGLVGQLDLSFINNEQTTEEIMKSFYDEIIKHERPVVTHDKDKELIL